MQMHADCAPHHTSFTLLKYFQTSLTGCYLAVFHPKKIQTSLQL